MNKIVNRTFWAVTWYSIAMAFLETAVVVYLRQLFYPQGFCFPLVPMNNTVLITEILREAATVIMLLTVAYIGATTFTSRLAYFMYAFALWDIFYYVFLKLIINWPQHMLEWDILFLLPVPWAGPVLAPIIVALSLIAWSILLWHHQQPISAMVWCLFASGCGIVIYSFAAPYLQTAIHGSNIIMFSQRYIPQHYAWLLFIVGQSFIVMCIGLYHFQSTSNKLIINDKH